LHASVDQRAITRDYEHVAISGIIRDDDCAEETAALIGSSQARSIN